MPLLSQAARGRSDSDSPREREAPGSKPTGLGFKERGSGYFERSCMVSVLCGGGGCLQ